MNLYLLKTYCCSVFDNAFGISCIQFYPITNRAFRALFQTEFAPVSKVCCDLKKPFCWVVSGRPEVPLRSFSHSQRLYTASYSLPPPKSPLFFSILRFECSQILFQIEAIPSESFRAGVALAFSKALGAAPARPARPGKTPVVQVIQTAMALF